MATDPTPSRQEEDDGPDDRTVPLFGSWPGAYTAVIVCAIVVMLLVGLFSGWPY